MNCKPGDLAVIVRSDNFPENVGGIVFVLEPSWRFDGWWYVEAMSGLTARKHSERAHRRRVAPGACGDIRDAHLRPIRNPGDDAVDTISLRKPEPVAA